MEQLAHALSLAQRVKSRGQKNGQTNQTESTAPLVKISSVYCSLRYERKPLLFNCIREGILLSNTVAGLLLETGKTGTEL